MAKPSLKDALKASAKAPPEKTSQQVASEAMAGAVAMFKTAKPEAARTPGRVQKRQVAGWFSDDAARQLRMMAAEEDTTLQALLTEALNDLCRKRGKPSIA